MTIPVTPKIEINNWQVYGQGTIVSHGNETLKFYPLPAPHINYTVELIFQNNGSGKAEFKTEVIGTYTFRLTLTNFGSSLGTALQYPVHIANHNGRKLHLNIAVLIVGSGDLASRITHYTIFDGGPLG